MPPRQRSQHHERPPLLLFHAREPGWWADNGGMAASPVNLIDLAGRRPLRLEDLPRDVDNVRYELIDGSLYVTPLADVEHQALATRFATVLSPVVPGEAVVVAGVNVILGTQTVVEPDVAVVDPAHLVLDGLGVSPKGLLFVVEIT